VFTASQLEELLALKERYRFASARERREIAQRTGETFRDQVIQTGATLTQQQTKNLFRVSARPPILARASLTEWWN
jgi:hypothetical protein